MTDPVAEAAAALAKQQAEPSLLEKAMDTIHDLEAKVEHLIHPESVPNVEPVAPLEASVAPVDTAVAPAEALSSLEVPVPAVELSGEAPNVLPASTTGIASESTTSADSGLKDEAVTGIQGVATVAAAEPVKLASAATSGIKSSIANIKHHLNIRGFEQSVVADIHAELDAIEKWL